MSEIKKDGVFEYVPFEIYRFKDVSLETEVQFEFPYLKDPDFIDYVDNGCGCTRAWFEDGKIKGILSVSKAGVPVDENGVFLKGVHPINKTISVMLDPSQKYLEGGAKKEKVINQNKPWFRLTLAGTVEVV